MDNPEPVKILTIFFLTDKTSTSIYCSGEDLANSPLKKEAECLRKKSTLRKLVIKNSLLN